MKIDLRNMTRKELNKLSADIEKALAKVTEREQAAALAAAEKAAKAHGYTLSELAGNTAPAASKPRRGGKAKPRAAAKYANPADASQTWSGRGRPPAWYKSAIDAGTSPDALAI